LKEVTWMNVKYDQVIKRFFDGVVSADRSHLLIAP
jgi:hypothetical protein